MTANGWLQFALFCLILLASVRPVGAYLARVLEGERTWLDPLLRPIERLLYKLSGVDEGHEMNWREYAMAVLGFSGVSLLATYGIERLQTGAPAQAQTLLTRSLDPDSLPRVVLSALSTIRAFSTHY